MLTIVSSKVPEDDKQLLVGWIKNGIFASYGDFMRKAIKAQNNGMDFSKPIERMLKPRGKKRRMIFEAIYDEGGYISWNIDDMLRIKRKSDIVTLDSFKENIEILKAQGWVKIDEEKKKIKVIMKYPEGAGA